MGEVELSCRAYVKMYLHACLFPRCSVNGLLLSSSPAGGAVCVSECVPLLHSHLSLAPITQLALTQVDVWCSQTQQRIVGYYQANACASDSSPTQGAMKIADKIAEQFDGAVLLMLDGSKMSPDFRVPPIVMYERRDSRWTLKDKHTIMLRQWEETRAIASQMLESGDHALLVDFDSHLDDITRDWTNQKVNAKIAELTSPANGNI
ncbi:ER membrane protein complex subunit 9 isoform X2 [Dunckerocampus dactyliophorus]|uniref:ER membrane protein complex subunit 9 isoform X2 n=1 Tax=Dunckerocampus dactyliophorus TaxID=161453 RepID=UPI002407074F|nr:ER membrane protein complex subunit 9 isoform X2 [Dunckerocampus dactyliophorus]